MKPATATKASCSVAIDKEVLTASKKSAKSENRSFSNYVETLLVKKMTEASKEPK